MSWNFEQIKVLNYALPPIAFALTLYRLVVRAWKRRFGAEDVWVMLSMILGLVSYVVTIMDLQGVAMSSRAQVTLWYLTAQCMYASLWASRVCIVVTVADLYRVQGKLFALRLVYFMFFMCWLLAAIQLVYICEKNPAWKMGPIPNCPLGRDVGIGLIIAQVVGDILIVFPPIWLLKDVKIRGRGKTRIISVLWASLFATVASLYYVYCAWNPTSDELTRLAAVTIFFSVSLIVANLHFLVRTIYPYRTGHQNVQSDPDQPDVDIGRGTGLQMTSFLQWSQTGTEARSATWTEFLGHEPRARASTLVEKVTSLEQETSERSEYKKSVDFP